ncbi:hypothetical protein GCM10009557_46740 [Virgisporangium ochraceum]|uniref:Uncharacterized protein n=1 Tax=Virgisporangium ochraceum TaxID=65505 RepID=A0A8J3ZZZ0_9ACTN|nr:hypothetical protein [Virgisporangium ochraceum]GIJ70431.1 hypothetical protein Voc01_053480 [Virgisporangium ochraceum]
MSYPDPALTQARNYLISRGIPGASIGIVGDQSHRSKGGYHVGNDVLARIGKLHTDYSKRQTDLDRPGSNAAMALDIGGLSGRELYELTSWLIAQCRAGTADTRNIREIIGRRSPSGGVTRYDALGILPDSGSDDHESHTHISYFRDSEGQDKTSLFVRYFEPFRPTTPLPDPDLEEEADMKPLVVFTAAVADLPARWGMGVVSGGERMWFETLDQDQGTAYAASQGVNASTLSQSSFAETRHQFGGAVATAWTEPSGA